MHILWVTRAEPPTCSELILDHTSCEYKPPNQPSRSLAAADTFARLNFGFTDVFVDGGAAHYFSDLFCPVDTKMPHLDSDRSPGIG